MFRKVRRLTKEYFTAAYNYLFNREQGVVYMLHRVDNPEKDILPSIAELYVSSERLEAVIKKHIQSGDEFISLSEVEERIKHPQKHKRKYVAFTFDDGYRDNLTNALPIFEKYNISFTIFITTNFIDQHPCFNYPFILERIVRDNTRLHIAEQTYECATIAEKEHTFKQLKEYLLTLPYPHFEEQFKTLFADYYKPEYAVDDTLTWDEVRMLANHPLCTIGAHTRTHCRLTQANTDLYEELQHCKQIIEENIGQEVQYVSYPFGWITDVDNKVVSYAKKVGYAMGMISWGGSVRKKDKDLYNLKRQMLLNHD